MDLLNKILELLLGYKYKCVILKDRGVERYWVCSYIFECTPEGNRRLEEYLQRLENSVNAHTYYETITFRSRKCYTQRQEKNDILKDMRRYAGKE